MEQRVIFLNFRPHMTVFWAYYFRSMFTDHPGRGSGHAMWCQGPNLDHPHARQEFCPLFYPYSLNTINFFVLGPQQVVLRGYSYRLRGPYGMQGKCPTHYISLQPWLLVFKSSRRV